MTHVAGRIVYEALWRDWTRRRRDEARIGGQRRGRRLALRLTYSAFSALLILISTQTGVKLSTSRTFIQIAADGEVSIVVLRGAANDPSLPPLPRKVAKAVIIVNELALANIIGATHRASEDGSMVLFQPSRSTRSVQHTMGESDWLLVNETEAADLGDEFLFLKPRQDARRSR